MNKVDRIQQLHRIFCGHRYPVTASVIAEKLECSKKTAKAAIYTLRDELNAPILYEDATRGWRYDRNTEDFQLPGLWLTASELHGLGAILQILKTMDAGLLGREINVISRQVDKLLKSKGIDSSFFESTVKYLSTTKRVVNNRFFTTVVDALVHKKQLNIHYKDYSNKQTQRTVSPQNIIYYQENWYLDAWCHRRNALRSFMLPRIQKVFTTAEPAHTVSESDKRDHYATSYGIFAGKPKYTAVIKFYPPIDTEAAAIQWHPQQQSQWCEDGYQLSLPYNDDRELVRDILQYGNNAEVIEPTALKNKIKRIADSMVAVYTN